MLRAAPTAILPLILTVILALPPGGRASPVDDAAGLLRHLVEEEPVVAAGDATVEVSGMLRRFYRERNYLPAWTNSRVRRQAEVFVGALLGAEAEGLSPEDYPVRTIESLMSSVGKGLRRTTEVDLNDLAGLDILLTDTFFNFAYHLIAGRINPGVIEGEWAEYGWQTDLDKTIRSALDKDRMKETLRLLVPPHDGYLGLRDTLAAYRLIAKEGGWPEVPEGGLLRPGSSGERVWLLKNRLYITGDLDEEHLDGYVFDGPLELAVRRFQKRHGLEADGMVGPATVRVLNVPAEGRIRQIELNMERWRWLPEDLGDRHVFINVANFELLVREYGSDVMRMRIVVGKPFWHTPSFSARMTHIVLNPAWNVPQSIAVEEILPRLRKDPGYLAAGGFRVFRGWGNGSVEVDPRGIDWSGVPAENFPYRFQQVPGGSNPLGRVKFMFPNRFNVYLHDTPSKELFDMAVRAFSHGCIRIERPMELAYYLLRDAGWTYGELLAAVDSGEELEVQLPEPIEVHPLYWTAWTGHDGTVNFRADIYGRDALLDEALREGPIQSYR